MHGMISSPHSKYLVGKLVSRFYYEPGWHCSSSTFVLPSVSWVQFEESVSITHIHILSRQPAEDPPPNPTKHAITKQDLR